MKAVKIELYKHRLSAIAEEMGESLCRSAYSSNIKERKDYSCALFDAKGQAIAQAAHLPVHLGSMPAAVQAALERLQFEPGDSVLVNDPYAGGTHLPDITMIDPVFIGSEQEPRFYVANRAHHADVGGITPGSMPLSTEIFQEGIRIPPIKWRKQGAVQKDILQLILCNLRTPLEREGDLLAQWSANQKGVQSLQALCQKHGKKEVTHYAGALLNYSEAMLRNTLKAIPNGTYTFKDYLEDDGQGNQNLAIQLSLHISGETALFDWSGSAPQSKGCLNAIAAVTYSAALYALSCLLDPSTPANAGLLRPIKMELPAQSILNAAFPAAVVGGNVETSQRLVDVIFGALAQALPDRIPAASCGSMNNLILGGQRPDGTPFSYYETIAGGAGASPKGNGLSGVHTHMTNTLNTPIEALELSFPFTMHRYTLRKHSGGLGKHKGGDGVIRELEVLCETEATLLTERRIHSPYGLAQGSPGTPGRNTLLRKGQSQALPGKAQLTLKTGDTLRIETPGGGGWGPSEERPPQI